jgi:hypothetical protein
MNFFDSLNEQAHLPLWSAAELASTAAPCSAQPFIHIRHLYPILPHHILDIEGEIIHFFKILGYFPFLNSSSFCPPNLALFFIALQLNKI